MKTSPKVRKRLEDAGVWLEFRHYREQLKVEGLSSTMAHRRALHRFDPDPGAEKFAPSPPPSSEKSTSKNDGTDFSDCPEFADEMSDLVERSASEVEQIRWVARNLENLSVTPGDCCDPAAWTLLMNCRRSQTFADSFLLSVWPKIVPSRAQLESGNEDKNDGDDVIALLGRVREASEKAKASEGAEPS